MIVNEITLKREKLFKDLDSGVSPFAMRTTDQYVLYLCSNNQLRNHVKPYYLKSGGITRLKKELRKRYLNRYKKTLKNKKKIRNSKNKK